VGLDVNLNALNPLIYCGFWTFSGLCRLLPIHQLENEIWAVSVARIEMMGFGQGKMPRPQEAGRAG